MIERSLCPFVPVNILVDPFVADSHTVFAFQSTTNLLGAPALAHQHFHLLPCGWGKTRAPVVCLPRLSEPMGLVRPIAPAPAIPPQLPTDRGFMHTQHHGHIGLVLSSFQKRVNLLPLFPGQLRVDFHVCSSYFGR